MTTSSKQIPHDFHKAALASDWLVFFYFQHGKNKTGPQNREGRKALRVTTWAEVHAALALIEEASPTPSEIERRRVEVEKLEEVGRSPESSPTKQLAQMAAEVRPFMSGGEELARRKL